VQRGRLSGREGGLPAFRLQVVALRGQGLQQARQRRPDSEEGVLVLRRGEPCPFRQGTVHAVGVLPGALLGTGALEIPLHLLKLRALPAYLVIQGPELVPGFAIPFPEVGEPFFEHRAGFGDGLQFRFQEPDVDVPQPRIDGAAFQGLDGRGLAAGRTVAGPRGGHRTEDLLLLVGPLGRPERLVQRREHLGHRLRGGERRRDVQHVVADEQVEVADVLQRLRLAEQGQRRLRRRAEAEPSHQQRGVVRLAPGVGGRGRREGLLQPGGTEPVLRPRLQRAQVEVPVVHRVHGLQLGRVVFRTGEPADDRAGHDRSEAVGVGDRYS
jgi:hypothetical protein